MFANVRIHHYSMERQLGGEIMILDGRPFAGPVELIHHHSRYLDGFVTKPTIECQRPDGVAPLAWPGFTMLELEFELLEEAKKQGIKKVCHIGSNITSHHTEKTEAGLEGFCIREMITK